MARDYAKKNRPAGRGAAAPRKQAARPQKADRPKRTAPSHSQHGALSLKWILSLAAVGGFIGFIVFLNTLPDGQSQAPATPAKQTTQPQTSAPGKAKQDSTRSQDRERNFRFYDMLPESEVVPPKVQEYSPSPTIQDFNYVVQSGSFRSQADAERQRAQIAFQGLRASVQRIDLESGSVWYRVNVGPFESRSQMNAAVDKLVSINIQPLVRKVPREG
ncbi:SPOR domain-containing protein [Marinobacter sp.]|uniref:SPOR domain-containing protein n=1 Tax=Marinobacter sp. TaxID=50741 RepID=UPI0019EE2E40|nr:SPOR domain-containing protein [Marinobacter sp.]MBE0485826.1 SPOR domain-containing protein [Marinobacter sp.]